MQRGHSVYEPMKRLSFETEAVGKLKNAIKVRRNTLCGDERETDTGLI